MNILFILFLIVITYLLIDIRYYLKDTFEHKYKYKDFENKTRNTLYPVFSKQYLKNTQAIIDGFKKYKESRKKEFINLFVKEWSEKQALEPSNDLLFLLKSVIEIRADIESHQQKINRAIEANIAALKGESIEKLHSDNTVAEFDEIIETSDKIQELYERWEEILKKADQDEKFIGL